MDFTSGVPTERVLRVHTAAKLLGCSNRTVRRRILEKKIPAARIGQRALGIRISDVNCVTRDCGGDRDRD